MRTKPTADEKMEESLWLVDNGVPPDEAARRTGVKIHTLWDRMRRNSVKHPLVTREFNHVRTEKLRSALLEKYDFKLIGGTDRAYCPDCWEVVDGRPKQLAPAAIEHNRHCIVRAHGRKRDNG